MGSMRQLASMIRHVHEAHGLGMAEDSSAATLVLAPREADIAHVAAKEDPAGEAGPRAFQQD
jgi:hypothetical protein